MRKLKRRKSTEANQIRRWCENVLGDFNCNLDKVCVCVVNLQKRDDDKQTTPSGDTRGEKVKRKVKDSDLLP